MIPITSFYRFQKQSSEAIQALKSQLESLAQTTGLRGLCLLGREGINATLSGEAIGEAEALVQQYFQNVFFKHSQASKHPFHVFQIKIKEEIVTLGRPDLAPETPHNHHLSPEEWHQALQDPEVLVLDTRNDYEIQVGKFKNAIDFGIEEFRQFPEAVRRSGIDKDKRILMYCTGGIRCEKAILEMNEQGYQNVFQLEGGILNYLEKYPHQNFEGECFVFDYRVAVDQELKPSRQYTLCPHCGQPADQKIQCKQCQTEALICEACCQLERVTCSKNCQHHAQIGSRSARPHKQELRRRNM